MRLEELTRKYSIWSNGMNEVDLETAREQVKFYIRNALGIPTSMRSQDQNETIEEKRSNLPREFYQEGSLLNILNNLIDSIEPYKIEIYSDPKGLSSKHPKQESTANVTIQFTKYDRLIVNTKQASYFGNKNKFFDAKLKLQHKSKRRNFLYKKLFSLNTYQYKNNKGLSDLKIETKGNCSELSELFSQANNKYKK